MSFSKGEGKGDAALPLQAACYGSETISVAGESFSHAKGKPLTPMLVILGFMVPRDRRLAHWKVKLTQCLGDSVTRGKKV